MTVGVRHVMEESSLKTRHRPASNDSLAGEAEHLRAPETIPIVVAVTDRGAPPLTRYERVIVTVHP